MDRIKQATSGRFATATGRLGLALTVAAGLAVALFIGCGGIEGNITPNVPPTVEFSNVPADQDLFAYAPVIYWKGSDPDGFVEYYQYADIIDSTAIADPEYYVNYIPASEWHFTTATADTVYLLTQAGERTEHVFYIKCIDDRGMESPVIYRTFFRENNPPNVPQIKWYTASDESYANDVALADTFYVLEDITDTWAGLGFSWKSSDPDDRDLYTIPLQFRYYLEKVPHDTVWQWVAQGWSNSQELTIYDLQSGHYTLTVWARDDSFEKSSRPASISFNVYRPTFEQSILLLDCTARQAGQEGQGKIINGDQVGELYRNLTQEAALADSMHRFDDWQYIHYTQLPNAYKSFLGKYRLVIWFSENLAASGVNGTDVNFERSLREYVRVGGRLWVLGAYTRRNLASNVTAGLAQSTFAGSANGVYFPQNEAEFSQATSGVSAGPDSLPSLDIDTSKTMQVFRTFFDRTYRLKPLLPGVDILSTGSGAETAYYFKSYTDTASGEIWNDTAQVVLNVDTLYYPPTPTDCMIKLKKQRVREVTRVFNATRNESGEVISVTNNVGQQSRATVVKVSYRPGEPWKPTDLIITDYSFLPFSEYHYKPCALRYERLSKVSQQGYAVRYRVAIFTFPLWYLDNSQGRVSSMYKSMLDWFFLEYAH